MDIHKNARSCVASRALLVRRVREEGWTVKEAAEAVVNIEALANLDSIELIWEANR
jgi:hypothetical protein